MKQFSLFLLMLLPSALSATSQADQIKARQHAMTGIEILLNHLNKAMDDEIEWDKMQTYSDRLLTHQQALQRAFPKGSIGDSNSSPKIWREPEKFERLLIQLGAGFTNMQAASITKDKSQFVQGLDEARSTCRSCHRSYKTRW